MITIIIDNNSTINYRTAFQETSQHFVMFPADQYSASGGIKHWTIWQNKQNCVTNKIVYEMKCNLGKVIMPDSVLRTINISSFSSKLEWGLKQFGSIWFKGYRVNTETRLINGLRFDQQPSTFITGLGFVCIKTLYWTFISWLDL